MATQATYSIVYISPDSRLGDRIAIGVLVLQDGILRLMYSDQKLNSLKTILGDFWLPISKSLRASQKYIENISLNNKPLFNEAQHMLTPSYLSKLSVYSNGLIQYQDPKTAIFTPLFGLDQFFESIFPEHPNDKQKIDRPNYKVAIDQNFLSKVSEQVHVKIHIDSQIIPDFYLNFSLDAIGRNGVLYMAKYIDFFSEQNANISHLLVTNEFLNREYNSGKISNVSILGVEPDITSEEHKKWDFIHKCEGYTLYHPDQAAELADMFAASGASKFLKIR